MRAYPKIHFLARMSVLLGLHCVAQAATPAPGLAGGPVPQDSQVHGGGCRDLYSDTWVAQDALGRNLPSFTEVGPVKNDHRRVVGIFYVTWHGGALANGTGSYEADVSRVLAADPKARLDANHPLWKSPSYHWGEPEAGYFLSKDEAVIRKDMSMLADAGVDVLVMDVTNAVRYWDDWEAIFAVMHKMKTEGNRVPQFCFWAFNGPVITVVQDLFDKIYKEAKHQDLWFVWDDKPLLLYNGTPNTDSNGQGVRNPNPHYESAVKTDTNHPHYGNPEFCEEFYQDYTQEVKLRRKVGGCFKPSFCMMPAAGRDSSFLNTASSRFTRSITRSPTWSVAGVDNSASNNDSRMNSAKGTTAAALSEAARAR